MTWKVFFHFGSLDLFLHGFLEGLCTEPTLDPTCKWIVEVQRPNYAQFKTITFTELKGMYPDSGLSKWKFQSLLHFLNVTVIIKMYFLYKIINMCYSIMDDVQNCRM